MKISNRWATAAATAALLATSACATDPNTGRHAGQQHIPDAEIGGIGGGIRGYLLDDIVGGRRDRTARIVGAGIGGIAGAEIGAYMDKQERDMRARTVGTDVRVTRQGDDLILNIPSGSTFAYKSDTVAPGFQHTLDQIAGVLRDYDRSYVDVYGHTDSTGSDSYNQSLSERRAVSVANDLSRHGVNPARIATKGFGKAQPIASNATPEGQAANRRVEIKIVPIPQSDVR